jgi:hypothetical protein
LVKSRKAALPALQLQCGGCDEVAADIAQGSADVAAQNLSTADDKSGDANDHRGILGCTHALAVSQDAPQGELHSLRHGEAPLKTPRSVWVNQRRTQFKKAAGRMTLLPASASQCPGFADEVATDAPQSAADIAAQNLSAAKDEGRNADDHQGVLGCAHASAVSQNMPKGECHSLQHDLIPLRMVKD